ncbi:hypothetical protein [Pseudomonas helleri]|jgi:hypothetical protein|uniref:Uncharacterized protein n=1 Tax=Pseudomonas helleri TaxID=1608996 RepID=A0A6L5I0B7_9PSED|nr:hypothetical protein [Pseudomonas helleri]MQU08587.1 hypothetical protein [Pseudomonas helleri]
MTDKMRDDFESSPQFRGMDFTRSSTHPDHYESPYANGAWDGWKASREYLVIELPPVPPMPEELEDAFDESLMDGYNAAVRMRSACEKSIKAAGLKVKS